MLKAKFERLDNQARFIIEIIEGKISIENRSKHHVIAMLVENGYSSDPVEALRNSIGKEAICQDDSSKGSSSEFAGPDVDYILNMNLWSLTKEKIEALFAKRDSTKEKVEALLAKRDSKIQGKKWEANWNASNETPWYEGLFKSLEKDKEKLASRLNKSLEPLCSHDLDDFYERYNVSGFEEVILRCVIGDIIVKGTRSVHRNETNFNYY